MASPSRVVYDLTDGKQIAKKIFDSCYSLVRSACLNKGLCSIALVENNISTLIWYGLFSDTCETVHCLHDCHLDLNRDTRYDYCTFFHLLESILTFFESTQYSGNHVHLVENFDLLIYHGSLLSSTISVSPQHDVIKIYCISDKTVTGGKLIHCNTSIPRFVQPFTHCSFHPNIHLQFADCLHKCDHDGSC